MEKEKHVSDERVSFKGDRPYTGIDNIYFKEGYNHMRQILNIFFQNTRDEMKYPLKLMHTKNDHWHRKWFQHDRHYAIVMLTFLALVTASDAMDAPSDMNLKISGIEEAVMTDVVDDHNKIENENKSSTDFCDEKLKNLLIQLDATSIQELTQMPSDLIKNKMKQINREDKIYICGLIAQVEITKKHVEKAKREAEERRKREVLDAFSCFYKTGKVNADACGNVHSFYTVFQIPPDFTDEKRKQLEEMLPEYLKLIGEL